MAHAAKRMSSAKKKQGQAGKLSGDVFCNDQELSLSAALLRRFVSRSCGSLALCVPQVCRPSCPSISRPGSCRPPSATWAATRRASLCARAETAGAAAPPSTRSATAPRWSSEPWRPAWPKSGTPGTQPTGTLRSQVGSFLLPLWFTWTSCCW